jgi:hypothetical protein
MTHSPENKANLCKLAADLGYAWPDDESRQWDVLVLMAQTAAHWRAEVNKCQAEEWPKIERERIMQDKNHRIRKLAYQVKNLRMALRDYMAAQATFVREGLAEIQRSEMRKT